MLFFRSEADLNAWLDTKKAARGATLTVTQLWQLSRRWYHNRMDTEYHGRTLEQVQEIFREVGLVSSFWR
jgi:hypothetical protein